MHHLSRLTLLAALAASQIGAQTPARDAWAVDRSGGVYRLSGGQWAQVVGILKQVSVGQDGAVWGVTASDDIYRRQGDGWVQIFGKLTQITVGNAQNIWGVTTTGDVYQRVDEGWVRIAFPKPARHVCAAADGTVWAVDVDYGIWIRSGDTWRNVGGQVQKIVVGSATRIWGVTSTGAVFRFNPANDTWDQLPGVMNQVTMAADGEVWGVTNGDELMRWDGAAWASMGRFFKQVSVGTAESRRAEEDSPTVTFTGTWTRQPDNAASNGFLMTSGKLGDSVSYQFNGDSVVLYRRLTPDGGEARVMIDGAFWGRMFFKYGEKRSQIPAVLDNLGSGAHTIEITVVDGTTTVDAFEAPAPFLPNAMQQEGLAQINRVRAQAGVPRASLSAALNLAAQSHADYAALPGFTCCHTQTPGTPGATGAEPGDRARYFGYDSAGAESVLGGCGDNSDQGAPAWLGSIYHRIPYLRYVLTDIGCGNSPKFAVANFGSKRLATPATRLLLTWPPDKQTGIPIMAFTAGEAPPVPNWSKSGYPIGMVVESPLRVVQGNSTRPFSATLTDAINRPVPFTALTRANDRELGGWDFFIVPNQFLTPATTYNVTMAGTDGDGNAFEKAWSFTTFPASSILNPFGTVRDNKVDLSFQWSTAGPVVSTEVRYGPTPDYGLTAKPQLDGGTTYTLILGNLAPGTYHYQFAATDATGVTSVSPNRTLTIPPAP